MTPAPHIPLIVELHAEDAAILWLQRDRAVDAPHFNRKFLARLDERLEANLDGLRVAGRAGWEVARAAFDKAPEPGEAFTLSALAFGAGSARGIGEILDIVAADETGALTRAAISGLGWLDPPALRGLVQPLLDDRRIQVRALGLGACSVHRVDPGSQLAALLGDAPPVRARALKLAGQLGRTDLLPRLMPEPDESEALRFEGARAAVLAGDRGPALDALKEFAAAPGPYRRRAVEVAMSAMDGRAARSWIRDTGREALAVRAAGLLGHADGVPWLIERMGDPDLGRTAGESFSLITGADLAFLDLDGAPPPGAPEGPNDDPSDPYVDLDADADLAWPDPALVGEWWAARSRDFTAGRRYFLGAAASEPVYRRSLDTAYQRQRRAAALALACVSPGAVCPNWRARER